ncbi:hypothetical protein PoB_005628500 [Plakobranchus ocellatus]|uniref:Uncharacterized protein n=1 Tax=Plakobranchus ocellatus TaxID=259542 RepID=A0AAV4CDN5_9GAST|nr:hypothetical protein PoB_005628500 [Plakobranchus ocellatus]
MLSQACTGPQSCPISDADDAKIYLAQNSIQEIFTDFTTTLLNESPARPRDHVMELAQQLGKQTKIKNEMVANFPFLSTKESRARLRDKIAKFEAKTDQEVTISASSENAVMDDTKVIGRNNHKRQSTVSSNVTSQPTELPETSSDSDDSNRTSFETSDNVGHNNGDKGSSESSIWGISRAVSGLDSMFNVSDLDTEGFALGSMASIGTFQGVGAAHAAISPKFTGCPQSKEDIVEGKDDVSGRDDDVSEACCCDKTDQTVCEYAEGALFQDVGAKLGIHGRYYLSHPTVIHYDAQYACERIHGHLLEIDNQDEISLIRNAIGQ